MAVYVDPAAWPFGRMMMCHLWADTDAKLHAFARQLGLERRWHQCPPKASWSHYDISKSKRALAVRLGAVETDKYGPSEHVARLAGNTRRLEQIARIRAREHAAAVSAPSPDLFAGA